MKIGVVCYPTYGGSGIVATELGKAFADLGNEVHFISYRQPVRLDVFCKNIFHNIKPSANCLLNNDFNILSTFCNALRCA